MKRRDTEPLDRHLGIDDEVRLHIEMQVARYREAGASEAEARRLAAARFGSPDAVRREIHQLERRAHRRERRRAWPRAILGDGRDALRAVRRKPGFAAAVIATVALAVGVATSLFTVVNALAIRPVPGLRADGLVKLYNVRGGVLDGLSGYSYPTYLDFADQAASVSHLTAFSGRGFSVEHDAGTTLVLGQLVSGSYFEMLGTRARRGRLLAGADDHPGAPQVAVVSHAYWIDQLGGAPDVLGQRLRINQHPFTVVGITEPGFRGPFTGFPSDIFVPLHAASVLAPGSDLTDRTQAGLEVMGRLEPGVTLRQAGEDFDLITAALSEAHPDVFRDRTTRVESWHGLDADLGGPVLAFVGILSLIAGLIVAIACVNVAGLLLHRGHARQQEIAVRRSLGASQGNLVRQVLIETLLLFGAGQALGVALAGASTHRLHGFLPDFALPVQLDLTVDWRVLALATGVTLVTALLFGVAPAAAATRIDPLMALRPTASQSPRRVRLRRALVGGQFAVALVLLVSTGLLVRTLVQAGRLPVGFKASGAAAASASVSVLSLDDTRARAFFEAWLSNVRAAPGVSSVALAETLPLALGLSTTSVRAEGREAPPRGLAASSSIVSPGYFDTMGIPIVSGRDFSPADHADTEAVAIVSRATARRVFGTESPIGRYLVEGTSRRRVVGVAGNVAVRRPGSLDDLFFYVPYSQHGATRLSVVARGDGDLPAALRTGASRALAAVPLLTVEPLARRLETVLFPQRMAASIAAAFGGVGLALATVGLYGVVAFQAVGRRREIAVRLALGAAPGHIRRTVLGDGLRQALLGVSVGIPAAGLLAGTLRSFIPGVSAWDPVAMASAVGLLTVAALVAADIPARRAARVNPVRELAH